MPGSSVVGKARIAGRRRGRGGRADPPGAVLGVDLFAGAGGFSLGARMAGVSMVAAVEKARNACATYRGNLSSGGPVPTRVFERDILDLDPAALMAEVGLAPGRCDILVGGPPCQGYSVHRIKGAGVGDPRNSLLLRYFEFVSVLRPRAFLVENVPGLLWPRHKGFLDTFSSLASGAGYLLSDPVTLNARDYGVPQNRRRVFLLGLDRDRPAHVSWPPEPTHVAERGLFDPRPAWLPAAGVFENPTPEGDPDSRHMSHGPELVEAFRRTPPNGGSRRWSGRLLACHARHDGHSDVYGRIDPTAPGPTMTAACVNPSKGRFVHPVEHHGITLRQAARFQTFPDWFTFHGGLMSGGEQVGNAVPVEMARVLVAAVVAGLLSGNAVPAAA